MLKRGVSLIAQHFCHIQRQQASSKFLPQLQIVRNKFINYGVQGNRNSKQKSVVNKNADLLDDDVNHLDELVNIDSDAYVSSL